MLTSSRVCLCVGSSEEVSDEAIRRNISLTDSYMEFSWPVRCWEMAFVCLEQLGASLMRYLLAPTMTMRLLDLGFTDGHLDVIRDAIQLNPLMEFNLDQWVVDTQKLGDFITGQLRTATPESSLLGAQCDFIQYAITAVMKSEYETMHTGNPYKSRPKWVQDTENSDDLAWAMQDSKGDSRVQ